MDAPREIMLLAQQFELFALRFTLRDVVMAQDLHNRKVH
jgi:hypothetical protein